MGQLADLAQPFAPNAIKKNPSGYGSYVAHPLYTQRLLLHVGPFKWEKVEILRGFVPEAERKDKNDKPYTLPALEHAVVGVVWRLTVEIDGRTAVIEEAGDCEDPHNWPHDGARLKDATSDAKKRCSSQIGLGLHLYTGKEGVPYFLHSSLTKDGEPA
jgi:hypothetical protein